MSRLAAFLVSMAAACGVGAIPVEQVPLPEDGVVSDQAQLLDAAAEARINEISAAAEARDGSELAVVTIASTDGADARAFATQLFNRWGIGDRERDNGVLVFVAIDDRAAELILGDGVDDDAQVAIADAIMQREMVPRFRGGDAQGAILAGAEAVAVRLLGAAPSPAGESSDAASWAPAPAPAESSSYGPLDDPDVRNVGLGVAGAGGLGGLAFGVRRWLRRRPRRCDRCGSGMVRLDEARDDAHLSPAELKEESIESVDYDVWACQGCSGVTKLRYGAWFTRYAKCPKCGAKTKSDTTTTLVEATYSSGGRVRIDEHCEFCGYRHSYERTTPKKTRSSSSSSSFGGGSSSGRGSSGRW
jgi:uncharacterized protein